MIGGLIIFSTLAALTLVEFLVPKPSKTPEEKLGEALVILTFGHNCGLAIDYLAQTS